MFGKRSHVFSSFFSLSAASELRWLSAHYHIIFKLVVLSFISTTSIFEFDAYSSMTFRLAIINQ